MRKPKIELIYVDMDGVLADFHKRYFSLYGMEPREAEKQKKFDVLFSQFIKNNNFATLDLMPGAKQGIEFLKHCGIPVKILSSTANEMYLHDISKQKKIWLNTHNIPFQPIFVPGKVHKKEYAKPNTILIDDTESNIRDWITCGGIGIFHKEWETTLTMLRMYV